MFMPNIIPNSSENPDRYGGSLMQFTGLIDRNGKEIYEGDILSIDRNCIWRDRDGRYNTSVGFEHGQFTIRSGSSLSCIVDSFRPEIIGNVHEHPELLEGLE
jgi:uncharacterized phage protein (TIGR01671 family)